MLVSGPGMRWEQETGGICSSSECKLGQADGGDAHFCQYRDDGTCQWLDLEIAQRECATWPQCGSFWVGELDGQVVHVPSKEVEAAAGQDSIYVKRMCLDPSRRDSCNFGSQTGSYFLMLESDNCCVSISSNTVAWTSVFGSPFGCSPSIKLAQG